MASVSQEYCRSFIETVVMQVLGGKSTVHSRISS